MPSGLPDGDADLIAALDGRLSEAARRAGDQLACRPGCTECCLGPFPIGALDARRLRVGLERLGREDPERADGLRERARRAAQALRPGFPGDAVRGRLTDAPSEAPDEYWERHGALPCPALDLATGACELYAERPLSCRSFGPPVRIGDEDLPPCRLCFTSALPDEVERCRVELDPERREEALLDRLGDDAETLVAFALAEP